MEVSGSIIRNIIFYSKSKGVAIDTILEAVELNQNDLDDPNLRVSMTTIEKVWITCIELTRDPLLGLHSGELVDFSSIGILGYLIETSQNAKAAILETIKYQKLIGELIRFSVTDSSTLTKIQATPTQIFRKNHSLASRQAIESSFSFLCCCVRKLSGTKVSPQIVSFQFANPQMIEEYERIFNCTIIFGEDISEIVFKKIDLEKPASGYNPELFQMMKDQANFLIAKLTDKESFENQVKKIILGMFDRTFPSVGLVASAMSMSKRTLQRKLEEDHTSFQVVLDQIRKDLAIKYLENNMNPTQIAYSLGFSDPSAFTKSFSRWTGIKPTNYIREVGSNVEKTKK